jgi:hypothetical protein
MVMVAATTLLNVLCCTPFCLAYGPILFWLEPESFVAREDSGVAGCNEDLCWVLPLVASSL